MVGSVSAVNHVLVAGQAYGTVLLLNGDNVSYGGRRRPVFPGQTRLPSNFIANADGGIATWQGCQSAQCS